MNVKDFELKNSENDYRMQVYAFSYRNSNLHLL